MTIRKIEEGELAYHTPCAVKKDVTWITDKYGYRIRNTSGQQYPIVIIGDSNIAGSGLTQEDLLSEVLQEKLHMEVYPLSPERINSIFYHSAFSRSVPEIVIFASVERAIPTGFSKLNNKGFKRASQLTMLLEELRLHRSIQYLAVLLDRTFKANMLNYMRARINKSGPSLPDGVDSSNCSLYYSRSYSINQEATSERYKQSLVRLKEYNDFFKQRGIRFIFLPIPDKNTIYHEYQNMEKPEFLGQLVRGLQELEIEVVDTDTAFYDFYQKKHIPIYQEDDTHWNGLGVSITAELLAQQIRTGPGAMFR
jgi:hypothetical protein